MRIKFRFFCFYFYLCATTLFAQNEGNVWYFGRYSGLDFNSGSPVAITNSAMNAYEGCSSISDSDGNLLFYTDGFEACWNKNHQVMLNGDFLFGAPSSTQGALIVKEPDSESRYYVFTTDGYSGFGFYYSVVDMTLDGGLGGIIPSEKNIELHSSTAEKLTGVMHANGNDVWIIMHRQGTNSFYSYLLSGSGISLTPVISHVGPVLGTAETDLIGCIKASPAGDKIAMANYETNSYVFDFDNATGQLTNPDAIYPAGTYAYGVEFSASGEFLYLSDSEYVGSKLMQFDMTASDIMGSMVIISTSPTTGLLYSSLQIGPDGKIYISMDDHPYVGVINNPDMQGASCNFVQNGVYLGGEQCRLGLPNFINTIYTSYQLALEEAEAQWIVYPNPTTDYLSFEGLESSDSSVLITDITGSYNKIIEIVNGRIDVSNLPKGIYFIRLQNENDRCILRFVKE